MPYVDAFTLERLERAVEQFEAFVERLDDLTARAPEPNTRPDLALIPQDEETGNDDA